ncbi:MAG: Alkaline phosphatase precursor [Syntrophorhabdaceae bacterium PtaU1.Bin034]|nr:MAG: Alkaline phosphatase precursor [Syntrophorhabdaceae bacterium PtaU1.Bin034]
MKGSEDKRIRKIAQPLSLSTSYLLSFRVLFIALALLLFPPLTEAGYKSFAVVSDTHVGSRNSVYPALIKTLAEQEVSLIIHTGDAINKPGKLNEWERFLEITGPDNVVHLAPGNHDIRGLRSLFACLDFFPAYHSFSDGDTLFLILNTHLPGQEGTIEGQQLKWLRSELERPFRYKFVFLHHPLFPVVPLRGFDLHRSSRNDLHRLFVRSNVSLVVAGHDHLYRRRTRDGVTYVIAGASGGRFLFLSYNFGLFRYMIANRTDHGYSFLVKDMKGKTRDVFWVTQ